MDWRECARQDTQETVTRIPLGSDEATGGRDLYIILSLQHPLSLLSVSDFSKPFLVGALTGFWSIYCVCFSSATGNHSYAPPTQTLFFKENQAKVNLKGNCGAGKPQK